MKRIFKIISSAYFILLIPFSIAVGQDTKSEQKIKILVDDGSGTKVVIDTVLKDSPKPDSIKLKDGAVIYFKHSQDRADLKGGEKYRVITGLSKEEGDEWKIIYINKDKSPEKEIEKTFDVYVSSDDNESTDEKTRYVIAKDGMVVTVEGNDEAKAKELVKDIESKLGVKK
ncbi:MAG: hypothetical protein ABSF81_17585 [Bacteroidales bacterium]